MIKPLLYELKKLNVGLIEDLATSCKLLGDIYQKKGELDKALKFYHDFNELAQYPLKVVLKIY